MRHKLLILCVCGLFVLVPAVIRGQDAISDGVVKIGVVTDLSGVNLDFGGPTAVVAAQMAVEDFSATVSGKPIKIVSMDHQNKTDLASQKVREWFDQAGVDMVTELLNSGVALAVSKVAAEKKRMAFVVVSATTRLTNEDCNPYTIHYAWDAYATAKGTANAILKLGGKTWFFITADLAFGHSSEKEASDFVKAGGGRVIGSVRHPAFQGIDFSSLILQAQSSKADVVALANSSNDTVNAVKTAREFGAVGRQRFASLAMQISDINGMGLPLAQGLLFVDGWYWDLNDQTRAFARRFFERTKRMPGMVQAGTYSTVLQYLKAVEATGSDNADVVIAYLKRNRISDMFAKDGYVRQDGRMVHDMYLFQSKKPEESRSPWDYYSLKSTITAEEAFLPLSESKCSLVKKNND
jgi:branched-chain amino acid transport system substrate-binding protein